MEKLPVHFPLPLEEIANQRSELELIYLFFTLCHKTGVAGNNVIEMLKILSTFFSRNNYSSPPCQFCVFLLSSSGTQAHSGSLRLLLSDSDPEPGLTLKSCRPPPPQPI